MPTRTDLIGEISSGNPHGTGAYTTASFTPPSNSLLVVAVTVQENGSGGTLSTDLSISGGGLTFTSRVSVGTGGGFETYNRIYTAPVATGAPMTLTLDAGALNVAVFGISVVAYTGYNTSTPTGATATNTKTSGFAAPDAATATLSAAPASTSEVFAMVGMSKSTATATPGAGWTEVHDATNTAWGHGFDSQARAGSTSTSVAWVDVRPGGGALFNWAVVALEIKDGTPNTDPALVADRGTAANATAATTTALSLTSPTAIAVGNYLIARVAVDNSGTNGAAPGCTVTDPRSNTWTVLGPANADPGAAAAGATAYLCYTKVTTAYQAGDSLTFNWGGVSTTAKAIVVEEWERIHATTPVAVTAVTNDSGTAGSTTAVALAITPTAAGQLVYASLATEGIAGDTVGVDSDTTNGTWTALTTTASANATATNNQRVSGACKVVTASGAQTWNSTITSRDWAGIAVVFAKAASTIPAGTGAGTYSYVGAATGARTPKATAVGTYAYVGAAAGKETPKGAGAGAYAYVGAGTGSAPSTFRAGTGAGSYAYAGAAAGKRTPQASGAGSYAYAGAATGKRVAGATASGSYAYAGAATGKRVAGATGSGTYAYVGAATGKRVPKATPAGSYAYVGAATGKHSPVSSGAGTYAYAGSAAGKRVAKATSSGTYNYMGAAAGKRVPKGAGAPSGGFGSAPFGSLPFGWGPNTYHYAGAALTSPAPGQGAGAGSWAYVGAGAGKRTPKATGSSAYVYVGFGSTTSVHSGIGVGSYAYSGSSTGKRVPKALAPGVWQYTGAAVGSTARGGSGAGSWTYDGFALGSEFPFVAFGEEFFAFI